MGTRTWLPAFLILLGASAGAADSITFGVRFGIPLTENFDAGNGGYIFSYFTSSSKTRRYTVGPTVTVPFSRRLGLEVDALYRRLDFDWFNEGSITANDAGVVYQWSSTAGNRIDLPLLLRWSPIHRFYVVGGPAPSIQFGFAENLHTIQNLVVAGYSNTYTTTRDQSVRRFAMAVTFGAGFEAHIGRVRVKPEVRYSHWVFPIADSYLFLQPTSNDVQFLVGFEFAGRR